MPYVPIEWLHEHVDVPTGLNAERLTADLMHVGLEEECIVPPAVTGPLVVGKVLIREAKEQSSGEVINCRRVDIGPEHNNAPGTGKEPSDLPSRGIVCGAHNFDVGSYVTICLPDAALPGDFHITTRKTRGHVSDGIICSARELDVREDRSGTIVLQQWLAEHGHDDEEPPAPGTDATSILGLGEEVLEVNVTPDHGYCFAMRGMAREYSRLIGTRSTDPVDATNTGLYLNGVAGAGQGDYDVIVPEDPRPIRGRPGCDHYVARLVYGVDPSVPSPAWMQDRLTAAGIRPISLVVGVTNYVMLDLGQPLHAFDTGKLTAPTAVRRAKDDEHLTFLNGITHSLDLEDPVIADSPDGEGSRVLALAGVFGGALSEADVDTRDVLIEVVHFDPVSVAHSSWRHKLPIESFKRDGRGVDTGLTPIAAQHAVSLLVEYGGDTTEPVATDANRTRALESITMRADVAERLTGVTYRTERVTGLLTTIDCTVERGGSVDDETVLLTVIPPTWCLDLVGPAHPTGEIVRLNGYDAIPVIVPTAPVGTGLSADQRARRDIIRALIDAGLTQVLPYLFIGDIRDLFEIPADDARRQAARPANLLVEDAPYLRTSVLNSLVDVARCNVSCGLTDVTVFEADPVIHLAGTIPAPASGTVGCPSQLEEATLKAGIPAQPTHIGAVITGEHEYSGVPGAGCPWNWADAVETVRTVAAALRAMVEIRVLEYPYASWHPGRTAEIRLSGRRQDKEIESSRLVAHAGELHPRVVRALGLPERACAVEIGLNPLLETARDVGAFQTKSVSTFPAAKEDIALVVDETTTAAEVEALVRQATGGLAEEVRLFDVFRGPQLDEGRKSLVFSLALWIPDRTLITEEVTGVRKRMVKYATKLLGAELCN